MADPVPCPEQLCNKVCPRAFVLRHKLQPQTKRFTGKVCCSILHHMSNCTVCFHIFNSQQLAIAAKTLGCQRFVWLKLQPVNAHKLFIFYLCSQFPQAGWLFLFHSIKRKQKSWQNKATALIAKRWPAILPGLPALLKLYLT